MSNKDVIRAWKDEEYREGLGRAARSALPENPAGAAELPDAELKAVVGARATRIRCGTGNWLCWGITVSISICGSLIGTCRGDTRGCC